VVSDTVITLVIAKAPPPPSTALSPPPRHHGTAIRPIPTCALTPAVEHYDCAGGSRNGPEHVAGPIRVRPADPFDLDREGDGLGCEDGNSRNAAAINRDDPPVELAPDTHGLLTRLADTGRNRPGQLPVGERRRPGR
jgi:hypothetical protein